MNDYANVLTEKGISIEQSDEFNKYFIGNREIKLEVKEQKDWFDIKANVTFGEFTFPFLALKENILKGKREFILPNGLIAVIPDEWFGNLAGMLEFSSLEEEIRLEKHHVGLIEELTNDGGRYLRLSDKLQKIKAYGDEIKEMPMPEQFKGELRPYQKAGFDWFYFLKENGFGGCLADDMGLGKTIQTLALLQKEKELFKQSGKKQDVSEKLEETSDEDKSQLSLFRSDASTDYNPEKVQSSVDTQKSFNKTSLIVVPNSLVYNWHKESKKFTPGIKTLVYTGINREKNPKLFALYDLIITTYGTVRVDVDILKDFSFNYVILDESQSIKNPNSLSSRAIKQLRAAHKLVLTGTPIENSIQELWSQLSFINPGLVGSLQSFTERFVTPIEKA
jgi:SNF2 family DNA or RNA helicase